MDALNSIIVTAVIFAPLLGALILAFIPSSEREQIKVATLVTMIATFVLTLWMYSLYEVKPLGQATDFQLQLQKSWADGLGISYHVGVDGVAVTLMLLTGFLGPLVVLAGWNNAGERAKEFCVALLVLQASMLGTFAALDLILFYVFWEGVLIPMYLLIGIFGSDNREYASIKFFLYTMVGSMPMLVAIIYLYAHTSGPTGHSFDYSAMLGAGGSLDNKPEVQVWLFLAFALAFAIKVPMWPLHTWLPDAHTEAPAAGSMVLAGVMLKMGTFGFMRYAMPLFPAAARYLAPWLGILSVIGIVYGSLMSLTQRDMKRLVAYSSVAHLGFVMLGLSALDTQGSTGAVYQMVNHGISTGALFLLIGAIYERRHTRLIAEYGGLAKVTPIFAAAFLIITFSSVALPGTNGFIGEFLILSGTFSSGRIFPNTIFAAHPGAWAWVASIGATGVILGAAYMLYLAQRVWFGPLRNPRNEHLSDMNLREAFAVVPLILVAIGMGIYPQPFLDRINPTAYAFTQRVAGNPPAVVAENERPAAPSGPARPAPVLTGGPGRPGPRPFEPPPGTHRVILNETPHPVVVQPAHH